MVETRLNKLPPALAAAGVAFPPKRGFEAPAPEAGGSAGLLGVIVVLLPNIEPVDDGWLGLLPKANPVLPKEGC